MISDTPETRRIRRRPEEDTSPPSRVRQRPGLVSATVEEKARGESDYSQSKQETQRPNFDVHPGAPDGFVRVGGGVTLNMGGYNMARVDVMIELPVGATQQQMEMAEVTYRQTSDMVERLLQREIDLVNGTEGTDTNDGKSSGSPFG